MESCLRHSYFWIVWNLQNVISGCLKYFLLFLSHAKLSWGSHFSEVWALTVSEFYICSHYAGWGGPSQPRPPLKVLKRQMLRKSAPIFQVMKKNKKTKQTTWRWTAVRYACFPSLSPPKFDTWLLRMSSNATSSWGSGSLLLCQQVSRC